MKINRIFNEEPELLYTPVVFRQIEALVRMCVLGKRTSEVGWMGMVEPLGGHRYLVNEIFVPEQIADGTNTEIDKEVISVLGNKLLELDYDTNNLIYWGHVHPNMAVSPSTTDEEQLMYYGEEMQCDTFIRGIYNNRSQSRIDIYDFKNNFAFEDVHDEVYIPQLTRDEFNLLKQTFDKNVKYPPKPAYVAPAYPRDAYGRSIHQLNQNSVIHGNTLPADYIDGELDDDDMSYLEFWGMPADDKGSV
jgi:hypothetical protein